MNIAFVTTRLFDQPRSGGEICTARLLQELAHAGHQVHVLGRGAVPTPRCDGIRHSTVGPLEPAFDDLPRWRRAAALLAALATGQASTVQRLAAGGAAQQVLRLLSSAGASPPDALWVDHLQVLPWVAAAGPALPAPVIVMHNLESDGYAEMARQPAHRRLMQWPHRAALQREARLLRRLEHAAVRSAAALVCLSRQDAAHLRARWATGGTAPAVEVLPGFPLRPVLATTPPAATPGARPAQATATPRRIGLIGTWTWGPNRAGLQWMLDQVLPHLPAHCQLVLAGAGLEGWQLPQRTQSLGRIDDVSRFYDAVDLVAIPSLYGSGVQEKAIDAIGSGKTVVATSHGVRGLQPGLPATVHIADAAVDFAQACALAPSAASAQCSADRGSVAGWAWRRQQHYRVALERCLQASRRR